VGLLEPEDILIYLRESWKLARVDRRGADAVQGCGRLWESESGFERQGAQRGAAVARLLNAFSSQVVGFRKVEITSYIVFPEL